MTNFPSEVERAAADLFSALAAVTPNLSSATIRLASRGIESLTFDCFPPHLSSSMCLPTRVLKPRVKVSRRKTYD